MEQLYDITPFSMAIAALLFGAIIVLLPSLISPRSRGRFRRDTYESGEPIIGEAWVQVRAHYYIYALIFVAFDVETAFIVPCVVVIRSWDSWLPVIEVCAFLIVLSLSLVYALKKNVLKWE